MEGRASLTDRVQALLRSLASSGQSRGGVAPAAGQPSADGGTPATSRYEPTWTPADEATAKLLIYNTESEKSFEEGGLQDYERLAPFMNAESTVLDLGCGIGRVARFVAPHCRQLWAVDVSQQMLNYASQRLSSFDNVQYVHSTDVTIPSIPSGSVDLAYSLLVLQHLEREDAFLLLEELRRLVKPSGALYLSFPNLLSDVYLQSFLDYAHSRASSQPARARMYTPQEVVRILTAAGFDPHLEIETETDTEIRVSAHPS